MTNRGWTGIVLAAGQGTRMKSPLPKVLHPVAGRPLVHWVVGAALDAGATEAVVVVGHGAQDVTESLKTRFGDRVRTVVQLEQRGTGHAVQCVLEQDERLLARAVVLYGDCPLIPARLLRELVQALDAGPSPLSMVTGVLHDPTGYGRIDRDDHGTIRGVVEDKDCTELQRAFKEVNPGLYAVEIPFLENAVASLSSNNAQGELYLTDIVEQAYAQGGVADVKGNMQDLVGINQRADLARVQRRQRAMAADALMDAGVSLADPDTTYIDADCLVAPGVHLGANVHLRGACKVSEGAHIDTGCILTNVEVGEDAVLLPYCVADDSVVGPGAKVGPFAHLRPGTQLGARSKVGNFSETKNTILGEGSKVNHLSYVGDGRIGRNVNIGAGTIFCNYDGAQKHITTLEDGVFVGSDSQLVAPVTVGEGAYIASGTTVTKDVPPNALALGRAPQENKEGYASRLRARQRHKKK